MSPEQEEQERSRRVANWLAAAVPPAADTGRAWERFQRRRAAQAWGGPARPRLWGMRPAWLALAASAALVGSLGFSPRARSATARMLSLFRVTRVVALPLNVSSHSPLDDHATSDMLRRMISDEVTVTRNEKAQNAPNAAAAAQAAGFALRLPADAGAAAPQFRVQGGKDFHMTVDRARAQAILADAGLAGVQLPASLEGAEISVHLPRMVTVLYGDCAAVAADSSHGGLADLDGSDCTVVGQGPSPTVSVPPDLDVQKIAEVGLQLLGMSASEAQQYCQTIDWTSTLVVAFPRGEADSRQVTVDGVSGILLTRQHAGAAGRYVLLWSRQGMLYSIAGTGDGSQGLSLAAQLPQ